VALVLYGGGIIDQRGSVSGNTFSKTRFGAVVRAKTSFPLPITKYNTQQRGSFVYNSRNWSTLLTDTERASWNSFALLNPMTNRFGQIAYLSGQQWYVKLSNVAYTLGTTPPTTPPASASYPGLTDVALTGAGGGSPFLTFAYVSPVLTGDSRVRIYATPNLSPGISYTKTYQRLIGQHSITSDTATSFSITSMWQDRFGGQALVTGKQISILAVLIDADTGASGPGFAASVVLS
jgi:hypothetical protein